MALFELIFNSALGLLLLILGLIIWKKQKIELIHSYHYERVKENDKKAYTRAMGLALITISIGLFLTGIINFITKTAYGWLAFTVFVIAGFIQIFILQRKYNGGLF